MAHSRETAQQVRSEYIDTMAKVYYSYFKDYYSKLMKIQVSPVAAMLLLLLLPVHWENVSCVV